MKKRMLSFRIETELRIRADLSPEYADLWKIVGDDRGFAEVQCFLAPTAAN